MSVSPSRVVRAVASPKLLVSLAAALMLSACSNAMERFASMPEFVAATQRAGFRQVRGEGLFPGVCGLVTGVRS